MASGSDIIAIPTTMLVIGYSLVAVVLMLLLFGFLNPKRLKRKSGLHKLEIDRYADELFSYSLEYSNRIHRRPIPVLLKDFWQRLPWLSPIEQNVVVERLVTERRTMTYSTPQNFIIIRGWASTVRYYVLFKPPPKLIIRDETWKELHTMTGEVNINATNSFFNNGNMGPNTTATFGPNSPGNSNNTSTTVTNSSTSVRGFSTDVVLGIIRAVQEGMGSLDSEQKKQAGLFIEELRGELPNKDEGEEAKASRAQRALAVVQRNAPWLATVATGMENVKRMIEAILGPGTAQ